jgi:hypothetical protein
MDEAFFEIPLSLAFCYVLFAAALLIEFNSVKSTGTSKRHY